MNVTKIEFSDISLLSDEIFNHAFENYQNFVQNWMKSGKVYTCPICLEVSKSVPFVSACGHFFCMSHFDDLKKFSIHQECCICRECLVVTICPDTQRIHNGCEVVCMQRKSRLRAAETKVEIQNALLLEVYLRGEFISSRKVNKSEIDCINNTCMPCMYQDEDDYNLQECYESENESEVWDQDYPATPCDSDDENF
eukprot:Lithocolla_globosa_v1_NODE_3_length_14236_cov_22.745998.p9 type:complete len:196 gc:universal NODE_3_length_14236_cov_22.745998:10810-10223(-)